MGRTSRLLFIDSGLGGLTVLRAARQAIPEATVLFIADNACFPYGSKCASVLSSRLVGIVQKEIGGFKPDCIVLACNTASTVALQALRKAFATPIVGAVPAVKPAAALTKSGLVSVLATPGTIAREYTRELIAQFGAGARFNLVGAPKLAELAEMSAGGSAIEESAIASEIAPCFVEDGGAKTDVVVLGCTHYPLLLDKLDALAPWPVTWLDPAPAIARRIANVLAERGHVVGVGVKRGAGIIKFTSGRTASASLSALLQSHNLSIAPYVAVAAA